MWLMYLEGSWVIKVATGIAASTVIGIVYLYGAIKVGRRVLGRSRALPNWSGRYELGLWMRFREHLKSVGGDSADPGQSDDLLSYAVALNIAGPWLNDHTDAPAWFQVASAWSARKLPRSRRRAYHGLMSSECWGLKGRSERAEGWAMEMV